MAKVFGKIVLASTVLAGAALGAVAYFKKDELLEAVSKPSKKDFAAKVVSDAEDLINKERSYVDLGEDDTEEAAEAEAPAEEKPAEEAKEEAAEVKEDFEPGIKAENIETAEDKVIGSTTSEEFFNDENK